MRKPRIHSPTSFYHIMLRGNNGENLFFNKKDYSYFCLIIQKSVERFDHRIHGFCLMSNHIHLVIQAGIDTLSTIMQSIAAAYSRYINRTQKRIGHLYQGRFKSILIDDNKYLSELIRYAHLNPVRAGIVKFPEDYIWSSHRAFLGIESIPWLTQNWILKKFHDYEIPARKLYESYVNAGIGIPFKQDFFFNIQEGKKIEYDSINTDANNRGKIDKILSKTENTENTENIENIENIEKTEVQKEKQDNAINKFIGIILDVLKISLVSVKSTAKSSEVTQNRGIIALLTRENPSLSLKELSFILEKDSSALSRLASRIEEKAKGDAELANLLNVVRAKVEATKD